MNQYVATIDRYRIFELAELLRQHGFSLNGGKNLLLSAKRLGCSVIVYQTLKLLVQGKETEHYVQLLVSRGFISSEPQQGKPKAARPLSNMLLPRIGSDESGKGDYFGPLVIAAVYIDERAQEFFESIGVRDSKRLSDDRAKQLAMEIRKSTTAVHVTIGPEKYNELHHKMRSVNRLLGWGHARAIENLLSQRDCPTAVADQFGDQSFIKNALMKQGRKVELIQMPKAEADTAVAAASIVARSEFLYSLNKLGRSIGTELPKGASEEVIQTAINIAKTLGFAQLTKVAKLHFRTTESVRAALKAQGLPSVES